jgi:ketosteroid isomerase-like protein
MSTCPHFSLAFVLGAALALAGCSEDPSEDPGGPEGGDQTTQHITAIQRRIEANNAKDWGTWESLHTADAVRTAPGLPGPVLGAKAMREGIEELVVTFPDYELTLVDAFGEEDRLMARMHAKGTMLGSMDIGGVVIPPTGKSFEQDWVAVLTFEGAQISVIDEFYDNYGTLIQLGLAQ